MISFGMFYLLLFSLFFLIITSAVLVRNQLEFHALKQVRQIEITDQPLVSICIPARNEEMNIKKCVESALNQNYPYFEVLVLDDQSTDMTPEILQMIEAEHVDLKIFKGAPKPKDWLGKPWACHQLSKQAQGDFLLFLDADVWLHKNALKQTVPFFSAFDAITVWPEQVTETFWEKMIVPMIYFALFTLLPAKYVERPPRWLPSFFKTRLEHKFVAACGQYFAFKRTAYDNIGGHEAVKDEVVEDMALAKLLKQNEIRLKMFHGADQIWCRMYRSHHDIWQGFQKNFYAGFGSAFEFFFMWVLHLIVYLFPVYALFYGLFYGSFELILFATGILTLIFVQRLVLAAKFKWNIFYGLLHPISVIWFQVLALSIFWNKLTGKRTEWKGRQV
tara:strand:+ start:227701 stop:228867 length:1167 start_codon:yes stop_codon:yes gene_type:complete